MYMSFYIWMPPNSWMRERANNVPALMAFQTNNVLIERHSDMFQQVSG